MQLLKKYSYGLLLMAFLIASCKKVINMDLNNAPSQIVIEGIINNRVPASVAITRSVKFSDNNVFPPVTGASVKILDNTGAGYLLTETAPGVYIHPNAIGIPGRTYFLQIIAGNSQYSATSTMPQQVNFDTLTTDQLAFGGKILKVVRPWYKDPDTLGNNYQFVEYLNGNLIQNIYTWNDYINNGGVVYRPLIYQADNNKPDIASGDTVTVEMRCIDKNVYTYMRALADLNSNNTTPANPPGNLSGNALGYFSAHTSQIRKVKIP
jgi:hypothetical protein